ncbi:hypothetical protein [Cohnella sp. GbtcB17]|uniref:hypothetical protein n=1 Tax=Cohnella sp. GbtcB17 TaxID=2824762 RepID=UPI001C2FFFA7|nr:hypothetical protein [Cohnella sp. GbtcB17]
MDVMAAGQWRKSTFEGCYSVVGENESLRVELVPSRGGKIVSLIDRATGRDWVYRSDAAWTPLRYGMQWDEGDRSGWDEMFPTILACPCPDEPWQHARYPDHGEVWTLPWDCELGATNVRLHVHGVQVPYIFGKTVSLSGRQLITTYEVRNPTPFPFSYLWCAHNLLAIRPGMRWVVDPKLDSVVYQYSHGNRMTPKPYGRTAYPLAGNPHADLAAIGDKLGVQSEKYWFEGDVTTGSAGIIDPATGEALTYLYDPADVPYLAVWENYGVFNGDYTAALEPATGYLDDVYAAHLLHKVKTVLPYDANRWDFTVSLDPAASLHRKADG